MQSWWTARLKRRIDAHALILTGAGEKAFAAGTDISRFRDFADRDDALEHVPVPTITATKEGPRRLRERATDVDGDDLIARCYTSADFREGTEAFLGKRKPVFHGE